LLLRTCTWRVRLAQLAGEERRGRAARGGARGARAAARATSASTWRPIRDTATVDVEEPVDLAALPWPDDWLARVRRSGLLGGPLQLEGSVLYLDRYWREERQVAADLVALMDAPPTPRGRGAAGRRTGARGRRPPPAARRRDGAQAALSPWWPAAPGTGKTTTVAHILALLFEQGDPLVALAAPTGKAAARLVEACTRRRASSTSPRTCARGS
jgi:exodeoxyribonuclease V alpha subunit